MSESESFLSQDSSSGVAVERSCSRNGCDAARSITLPRRDSLRLRGVVLSCFLFSSDEILPTCQRVSTSTAKNKETEVLQCTGRWRRRFLFLCP